FRGARSTPRLLLSEPCVCCLGFEGSVVIRDLSTVAAGPSIDSNSVINTVAEQISCSPKSRTWDF
ncbi:hypothetical protein EMCG_07249, partial [[Emmonsia] crescens]